MSAQKIEEVEEEFVGDGYGIGLATCFGIREPVGAIDIESKEGVGTQFTLCFER
jgi:signal transduction histidine kinase